MERHRQKIGRRIPRQPRNDDIVFFAQNKFAMPQAIGFKEGDLRFASFFLHGRQQIGATGSGPGHVRVEQVRRQGATAIFGAPQGEQIESGTAVNANLAHAIGAIDGIDGDATVGTTQGYWMALMFFDAIHGDFGENIKLGIQGKYNRRILVVLAFVIR